MRSIFTILLLPLLALFLSDCNKGPEFDCFFYQKIDSLQDLRLFVEGADKGKLPFSSSEFNCDSAAQKSKALHLTLREGKYSIVAMDQAGNTRSAGTVSMKQNGRKLTSSSSGTKGGQGVRMNGKCVIVEMF